MPDYVPGSAANLPAGAAERLKAMRGTGDRPAFFTSDLTVDEFLLVEQAGFEALGLVMGSSIYHVGFQWQKWSVSQELDVLSNAMFQARLLTLRRISSPPANCWVSAGARVLPLYCACSFCRGFRSSIWSSAT